MHIVANLYIGDFFMNRKIEHLKNSSDQNNNYDFLDGKLSPSKAVLRKKFPSNAAERSFSRNISREKVHYYLHEQRIPRNCSDYSEFSPLLVGRFPVHTQILAKTFRLNPQSPHNSRFKIPLPQIFLTIFVFHLI